MLKNMWIGVVLVAACGSDDGAASLSTASATVTGFMGGTVTGTATFMEGVADTAPDSVTVTVTLDNCVNGKSYPTHIHTGSACTDATTQGGHWDMTRGEGIPNIVCNGTTGTTTYNRDASDASLAWSVGGNARTNVIGHTIVVHDPDMTMTRIACGPIVAATR